MKEYLSPGSGRGCLSPSSRRESGSGGKGAGSSVLLNKFPIEDVVRVGIRSD